MLHKEGNALKNKKKTLKGMTLYEMIISIAIFAIMVGVLCGVAAHINRTTRATNNLKNKLVTESTYAANKNVTDDLKNPANNSVKDVKITVECGGSTVDINAKKYNTEYYYAGSAADMIDVEGDADKEAEAAATPNGNLNLEFVVIEPKSTT